MSVHVVNAKISSCISRTEQRPVRSDYSLDPHIIYNHLPKTTLDVVCLVQNDSLKLGLEPAQPVDN